MSSSNPNDGENHSTQSTQQDTGMEALKAHISTHKIQMALWCTRVLTIIFTLLYFLPIIGNPYSSYNKALIANAATSALRLHQRHPRMSFHLGTIIAEDSCHYIIYSLIFLYVTPFTLALIPIFFFALIHFASYSLTLLDTLGRNSWWGARLLISLVEFQSGNILNLIACVEITLMPFTIIFIFMGRAGLLTPFLYHQFLIMRYKSQRNRYTHNKCNELRLALEGFANHPRTPNFVRSIIINSIKLVTRFCPPITPAHESAQ